MLFLAPLHGYTDYNFRNVYSRYYTGIDAAISPFISLVHGEKINPRRAKDVLPANNCTMPVIPQVLGNEPELFIQLAEFLHGWGYEKINWNMGCPIKKITGKRRGSGLLPYPEFVRDVLEKIVPRIPQQLSVKIRLGLNDTNEIAQLIPVLNDFPLEHVTIHPRIGAQMYEGSIHHDVLKEYLPQLKHDIIYNGDIVTLQDYQAIQKRYPRIKKWMIGRGVFYNPLLPALIKGEPMHENPTEHFISFLLELYNELGLCKSELQSVNKAKDLWQFFSKRFVDDGSVFSKISHAHSMEEIIQVTQQIVLEETMVKWRD